MISSIISSDSTDSTGSTGFRPPWALLIALGVVGAVEVAVRLAPPENVIPSEIGIVEYHAVAAWLDLEGPAAVAFMGASRTNAGILVPEGRDLLRSQLGRKVSVANYACAAALARECRSILRHLLRRGRPELILYGVSPGQISEAYRDLRRDAVLWNLDDWRDACTLGDGAETLPVVARSYAGRWFKTLRYRMKPGVVLRDALRVLSHPDGPEFTLGDILAGRPSPCPAAGGANPWHVFDPERTLEGFGDHEERLRNYLEKLGGIAAFRRSAAQTTAFLEILELCSAAEVPLVLFEVPISRHLLDRLPAEIVRDSWNTMDDAARQAGVSLIRLSDLGLHFSDRHFRGYNHLNRAGAAILTRAVIEQIAAPALVREPTGR